MSALHTDRPWYCNDKAVDEWGQVLSNGEELPMLKTLKLVRSIVVNGGLFIMWYVTLTSGIESLLFHFAFLATIGLYNGLEVQDYLQLVQAYKEVQTESGNDGN